MAAARWSVTWTLRWSFVLALAATALLRLPGIDRPLVGHFATKNAVYAMIARNWATGRAPLWLPAIDCLAGGARGLHLTEMPIAALLPAGAWRLLGGSLDAWGRLTSILCSVGSVALMYWLVRRWHGGSAAWGAAAALDLSPVSVIYGQSFMLEASVVLWTLLTLCCVERWFDGRQVRWLTLAGVAFAALVLTKVYMVVLLLPLAALAWRRAANRDSAGRRRTLGALAAALAVASLPALVWYGFAYRAAAPGSPRAEHVFYSVRQSAEAHGFPSPLLWSAEFYRRVLDDLAGVVLTPLGLGLALVGLLATARACRPTGVARPERSDGRGTRLATPLADSGRATPASPSSDLVILAWLSAMALLVLLLPRKFHEMNYYWLVVIPPACVLVGRGWRMLEERLRPGRWATAMLLLVALVFCLRHAARPAFSTPAEDQSVVAAAAAVRGLATPNEPVATLHGSSLDLLYYCDRPGWALAADDPQLVSRLADCRAAGARLLVVAGPPEMEPAGPLADALTALPTEAAGTGYQVYRLADGVAGTGAATSR
jgi:4-amino-4-deoxy-L-arabinose transferase-like glycosyltransferase